MHVLSSRLILRVGDLGRSRAFYEEVLGLSIYREYGIGGVVTGVVYFLGGGFLELTEAERSAKNEALSIWVQVPDVRAEERRLGAAGVVVRKPAERMPWGLVECWIVDPDGTDIRLVEVPDDHPIRRRVE